VRVFFDANLLFAGAYRSGSNVDLLIEVAPALKLTLLTCSYAVGEAYRNIEAKVPNRLPALERLLSSINVVETADPEHCPIPLREKDRPILASALAARCQVLLTGDKRDFGPWLDLPSKTNGVRVLMIATFLAELARDA
jgi:uncharacterized protein